MDSNGQKDQCRFRSSARVREDRAGRCRRHQGQRHRQADLDGVRNRQEEDPCPQPPAGVQEHAGRNRHPRHGNGEVLHHGSRPAEVRDGS